MNRLIRNALTDLHHAVVDAWRGTNTISFSRDEKVSCVLGLMGFLCPLIVSYFAWRFNQRRLQIISTTNDREWVFKLSSLIVCLGWAVFLIQIACMVMYFFYWKVIRSS